MGQILILIGQLTFGEHAHVPSGGPSASGATAHSNTIGFIFFVTNPF